MDAFTSLSVSFGRFVTVRNLGFFSMPQHSVFFLSLILKPPTFSFSLLFEKIIFCYSHIDVVVDSRVSWTSGNFVMLNLHFWCKFQNIKRKALVCFCWLLFCYHHFAIFEMGTFTFHIFAGCPLFYLCSPEKENGASAPIPLIMHELQPVAIVFLKHSNINSA